MRRTLLTLALASFFMGATAVYSIASTEHEDHQPDGAQQATTAAFGQGMMGHQGMGMAQMPCMASSSPGAMPQMMGAGMGNMMGPGMMGSGMMGPGMMGSNMMNMGMMGQQMAHVFFLDRADELGLSTAQVDKLKSLHADCRRDNIRNAAEARITRLELLDLLNGDDWSLKDAEAMIRKEQKLEGDIQVRHLQAVSDARKVLSADQLKQAHADGNAGNLESLFQ